MDNQDKLLEQINQYYINYFRFDAVYYKWAALHEIKDTTLFILERIFYMPEGCSQKYLCETLSYPKQTISAALNRLEKAGMIFRQKEREDFRGNVIFLTDEGRKMAEKAVGGMRKAELEAFAAMSEEERATVARGLQILADRLDESFERIL